MKDSRLLLRPKLLASEAAFLKEERQRLIRAVLGPVPKAWEITTFSFVIYFSFNFWEIMRSRSLFLLLIQSWQDPADRSSPLVQLMDDRREESGNLEEVGPHGRLRKLPVWKCLKDQSTEFLNLQIWQVWQIRCQQLGRV